MNQTAASAEEGGFWSMRKKMCGFGAGVCCCCGVAFAIGILLTVFFPLKLLLFLSSVIIVLLGLIAITKL